MSFFTYIIFEWLNIICVASEKTAKLEYEHVSFVYIVSILNEN